MFDHLSTPGLKKQSKQKISGAATIPKTGGTEKPDE
jgi:hypothetical protein